MQISPLFLQRYDPLYNFYLAGFWSAVPHDLVRRRPHPSVNSIAWNIWHLTRCEDAGVNRFILDGTQVLDEDGWQEKLNLPWRHNGSGMTLEEVDDLNQRIDLSSLQGYCRAVEKRTREGLAMMEACDLGVEMDEPRLRRILVDEGLAHSNAEGFINNYLGWTRVKCLFTFALTHSWQHLGEMEVIATLLGVDFG